MRAGVVVRLLMSQGSCLFLSADGQSKIHFLSGSGPSKTDERLVQFLFPWWAGTRGHQQTINILYFYLNYYIQIFQFIRNRFYDLHIFKFLTNINIVDQIMNIQTHGIFINPTVSFIFK